MREAQAEGMQGLTRKVDRPQRIGAVDVAPLPYQRVPAQPRLDANLIAAPGHERQFNERRPLQRFDEAVLADGFLAARIIRTRFLLNQRRGVPGEMIAPGARYG